LLFAVAWSAGSGLAQRPLGTAPASGAASRTDIAGPGGSGWFGHRMVVLPNGNIVITDSKFNHGNVAIGAAYLYDGTTGAQISSLVGSNTNDQVGEDVRVLSNGNYVICSPDWNGGVGALTWGSATSGVDGVVSADNSLVGAAPGDKVGNCNNILPLSNGNYLARSLLWNSYAGAVTWGSGTNGVSGVVSQANSLVGYLAGDWVGLQVYLLSDGNYVVASPYWHNKLGAATWGSATSGVSGVVSTANSLTGNLPDDEVGSAIINLKNGNYVVSSPGWNNFTGAVTWVSEVSGISGRVSTDNSLVGSQAGDRVGNYIAPLSNGNYVVASPYWNNNVGAVTWVNGASGLIAQVSASNSLVGTRPNDKVGTAIVALSNGNYVVSSPAWFDSAGAATWVSGTIGISEAVSAGNSLVGSNAGDQVGKSITPLSNGNYVVRSTDWHNTAGAATWGSGMSGIKGPVSELNSLVGSAYGDAVGLYVTLLSNGNYLVRSPWNGSIGAVTWASGTSGVSGVVSSANSLVGETTNDSVGINVTPLDNGNYVVGSPYWNNKAGAATWGSGVSGVKGMVSTANSLVGGQPGDQVGASITAVANNNYVVGSPSWNGSVGAATWASGTSGVNGQVSDANSLVGNHLNDRVGNGVLLLSDGDYVVSSPYWNETMGAATWGSGTSGVFGAVSINNSLLGSAFNDMVGSQITPLPGGNYVVSSPHWRNGTILEAGAATWGSGMGGIKGTVSTANSLVGRFSIDLVGSGVMVLNNGDYVVMSPGLDLGTFSDVGAISYGFGRCGLTGPIVGGSSVVGATPSGGSTMFSAYDTTYQELVVSRPADNIVTLLKPGLELFLPFVEK
jgi:hypothetical protein